MFPQVNKILEFFLKNPTTTIYLRELARRTGFSPAGCLKALKNLKKQNLIEGKKIKAISNYNAKLTPKFLQIKKTYNTYSLYDSGLIDFLKKNYEYPDAIILFGSYTRGEDTEKSDIDIAIITRIEKTPSLTKYEKTLQRKINIIELKNLKKSSKEFINSLINGIILEGVLKL